MKIDIKKLMGLMVIIVPMVLVMGFFVSTFYIEKVTNYFNVAKEHSLQEYVDSEKEKSELFTRHLTQLFEDKQSKIDEEIKKELQTRIDGAYKSAISLNEKYKSKKSKEDIQILIVEVLNQKRGGENDIFITHFSGDPILPTHKRKEKYFDNYHDADGRSIILEEIQMVRKKGGGFLDSRLNNSGDREKILVKNLDMFDWYIGSSIQVNEKTKEVKNALLEIIQSVPIEKSAFLALYDDKKEIYVSSKMKERLGNESHASISQHLSKNEVWHKELPDGYYCMSKYYEPLNWHVVYGFDILNRSKQDLQKQEDLQIMIDEDLEFITKVSVFVLLFVLIISLLLSRKIK